MTAAVPAQFVRGVPRRWAFAGTATAGAAALGAIASGRLAELPGAAGSIARLVATLPPPALLAGVASLVLTPALIRSWQASTAVFLAWLVVEDLIRKLAGNDLRVYFIKDLFFALVVVALAATAGLVRPWRAATGPAGTALGLLVAWAVAMSIPSALDDIRIPLVGLRLDFMYAPLVVVGFLIGRDRHRLARWLTSMAAVGGAVSLLGITQAVVGPSFLAPAVPVRGLGNLVLIRGTATSGPVYRPTGPFVDPGRFAAFTGIALAVALAGMLLTRGGQRRICAVSAAAAAAAAWGSGGRGAVVIGILLTGVAALAGPWAARRLEISRVVAVTAAGVIALLVLALLAPDIYQSRLTWYAETLDPRSSRNEWSFRWESYGGATLTGIRRGGLIGLGTGRESLGKQYLYDPGSVEVDAAYRYTTEGGYAAVSIEWGIIGLSIWIVWTAAWLRRAHQSLVGIRGDPIAGALAVLVAWMWVFLVIGFFGGLQAFQNFVANAAFWLISGMVMAHHATLKDHD